MMQTYSCSPSSSLLVEENEASAHFLSFFSRLPSEAQKKSALLQCTILIAPSYFFAVFFDGVAEPKLSSSHTICKLPKMSHFLF